MTLKERKQQVRSYMGRMVEIEIDRPIGYVHQKKDYNLIYPINYGCIPGVLGGDGEELDVYLLGVSEPVEEYKAKVIGIVHRENDVEDKLVAAPEGMKFSKEEIEKSIAFQEQYYNTYVETESEIVEVEFRDGKFVELPREFAECFEYNIAYLEGSDRIVVFSELEFNEMQKRLDGLGADCGFIKRRICHKSVFIEDGICGLEEFIRSHFVPDENGYSDSLMVSFFFSNGYLTMDLRCSR